MEVVDIDDIRMRLAQPRVGIEMALEAYAWLKRSGDFVAFVALLHDGDTHVARNAAWVLTKATDRELSQLLPALDELIDIALSTSNDSLRRLTLNLIVRLPLTKECLRTDFLDFCLDQMVRLQHPSRHSSAVHENCPSALLVLSRTVRRVDAHHRRPRPLILRTSPQMHGKKHHASPTPC